MCQVAISADELLRTPYRRSSHSGHSWKFISKILHSLTPVPLKTAVQALCIAPPRYHF